MTALGQSLQRFSKPVLANVRCYPNSDQNVALPRTQRCAKSELMHRSKQQRYSITSSARTISDGGTSSPSAFAVLRLTIVSYLVGACTGRSAGLAPRRMRSA